MKIYFQPNEKRYLALIKNICNTTLYVCLNKDDKKEDAIVVEHGKFANLARIRRPMFITDFQKDTRYNIKETKLTKFGKPYAHTFYFGELKKESTNDESEN